MRRPKRQAAEPAPIREVLPGVLKGLKRAAGSPLERARKAWVSAVGPTVARRSRVAALESGRLRVEVASAALKHDLATFRRAEVLERLREQAPELAIREVQYRVASLS